MCQIALRNDAIGAFDVTKVEAKLAHQRGNQIPAQNVIAFQRNAAPQRMPACTYGLLIRGHLLQILRIGGVEGADGGDAQPQHIGTAIRRIPLKVAVQMAVALCDCKFIARARKVIHPNEIEAASGELGDGHLQKL